MASFNQSAPLDCTVLATDLDGTLIPLAEYPHNKDALETLCKAHKQHHFTIIYATGRHYESVRQVIETEHLPKPDWIICDVGTSIYHLGKSGFESFTPYEEHLFDLTDSIGRKVIVQSLSDINGLTAQPSENQQRFKISYQCATSDTERLALAAQSILSRSRLPFHVIGSNDPFRERGLIDVLPDGVSKAYALIWLSTHADFVKEQIVFAGDSGNDLAALTCGFHAIVVANASARVADEVRTQLEYQGRLDLFYLAKEPATSGVLEGCRHYGLIPDNGDNS